MPKEKRSALTGCHVLFTGTFENDKEALKTLVDKQGGSVLRKHKCLNEDSRSDICQCLFRVVALRPDDQTSFVVAGDDVTESKLEYMRKKGLRNISEKQLLLLIRYWANDKMYEDIPTPAVKSTPKKSEASPQKKKPVEKDTEKPAAKKRGPSKDERAAEIASLFKCVGRCMFNKRTVIDHPRFQL